MNFTSFMESYAEEIGGRYTEYDRNKSVIIVPLSDGRYQSVLGTRYFHKEYDTKVIKFSSKVCEIGEGINYKRLVEENSDFAYAKFALDEGFLKVEASAFLEDKNINTFKEMLSEVANKADEWEYKITGLDVH